MKSSVGILVEMTSFHLLTESIVSSGHFCPSIKILYVFYRYISFCCYGEWDLFSMAFSKLRLIIADVKEC